MDIKTHPAEQCMNELAKCGKPWFDPERFDIILRYMQQYAQPDYKVQQLTAELESERAANAILTEDVRRLENELERSNPDL